MPPSLVIMRQSGMTTTSISAMAVSIAAKELVKLVFYSTHALPSVNI